MKDDDYRRREAEERRLKEEKEAEKKRKLREEEKARFGKKTPKDDRENDKKAGKGEGRKFLEHSMMICLNFRMYFTVREF